MKSSQPRAWRLTRTSSSAPDPVEASQKAGSFGAAVRNCGTATLLTTNTDQGMEQFVLAAGRNPERVAGNLGPAVGAKVEQCDSPDLSQTRWVGRLVARPSSSAARETQANSNPAAVAEYLAGAMPTGSWVAITMRLPKKHEVAATRRWYDHRLSGASTHHTKNSNVLAVSVLAGGTEPDQVEGLLSGLPASLPGFDIETKPATPAGRWAVAGVFATVAALFAATARYVPRIDQVPHGPFVATATGLAVLFGVLAVLGFAGIIKSPYLRLMRQVADGVLPAPRRRAWAPRPPRRERTIRSRDSNGNPTEHTQPEFGGDYPLARDVFLVGPSVIVGVSSPHSGSGSRAAVTSSREVPPVMRTRIGPLIGLAGATGNVEVFIDQSQRYQCIGIYGLPGSGKTALVTTLFAYDLLARQSPPQFVDDPGPNSAMVAFESKGRDGVGVYQRWLAMTRTPALIVEVSDGSTPAIDMFDLPGPAAVKASFFVDAMIEAFGDQAISYRSANTLKDCLTAALLTTADDLAEAGLRSPMSPLEIVNVFLTRRGDEVGDRLARALTVRAAKMDPDDEAAEELHEAVQRLSTLYGDKVTAAKRRDLVEAPQSKVSLLLDDGAEWWNPARPRITFSQVLRGHQIVIVNTGQASSGATVNELLTHHLTSMLLFCLKRAIELTCNGWREKREAVNIYSDELSLLIGGKSDTFVWLRNQGRSFGVRMVLATQQPESLPSEVRSVVQSFGTFFWFKQNDATTITAAVNDLNAGGGSWSSSDVTRLPDHHAILRASVDGLRQDPIPVKLLWWGDGGERHFHTDQGFPDPFPGFAEKYPKDRAAAFPRSVLVDG